MLTGSSTAQQEAPHLDQRLRAPLPPRRPRPEALDGEEWDHLTEDAAGAGEVGGDDAGGLDDLVTGGLQGDCGGLGCFHRSKADKDPAEWLPTDGSYHCTYAATWVGTKLRWDLAVDEAERQALLGIAEDFPATTVVYEPAR